jgi:beta-galactosidase
MWAGGTNFAYWGGRTVGGDTVHNTTSYDYDAPITEYGELTEKALAARRHHLFLQAFGAELSAVLADAEPGGMQVIGPPVLPGRSEGGSAPYRICRAGPGAPARWQGFAAAFLQNPDSEGISYQVGLPGGRRLTVPVEAGSIRPVYSGLPLPNGAELVGVSGRILSWFADNQELVIYGADGEQGKLLLRLPAAATELADGGGSAVLHARLPEPALLELDYWLTDELRHVQLNWAGGTLLITLANAATASRYNGGGRLAVLPAPAAVTLVDLQAEQLAVDEVTADTDWQPLAAPQAQETLAAPYGYSWYRARWQQAAAGVLELAVPGLSDRARVLHNGRDLGRLGVHPFDGPRWTVTLPLEPGEQDVRLLVDNLGRFNYGTRLGEPKGLFDALYPDGRQEDLSTGWTALYQDVGYAGEAPAHARPWAVRPDRQDVDLRNFVIQKPMVWLLRGFRAEAGRRYQLYLTGDRNSGGCFVNGTAIERFSRHRSGGVLQIDITELVQAGDNVLALQILGYSGAPWQVYLISHQPEPLAAEWAFRAGVTAQSGSSGGPGFHRVIFPQSLLPERLRRLAVRPRGLEKGQIWFNGFNCGRYWQVGPQCEYKLPIGLLQATNELLVFSETAAEPALQLVAGAER